MQTTVERVITVLDGGWLSVGFLLLCEFSAVELLGPKENTHHWAIPPQKSSLWRGVGMGSLQTPDVLTLPISAGLMTHVGCGISAVVDTCKLPILSHFPVGHGRHQ